jgi:ATP-binding cassette subfamily C protein
MLQTIAAAGMIAVIFIVCVLVFHMDTARLIVLVYVFMRLWPAFSGVIPKIAGIRASIPAYEKLNEAFLNFTMENTVEESSETLKFEQEIEFRNVAFSYLGSQKTVLKDVNFVLKRGSISALVGRSGAGKTTIADLMLGLLSPSEGQILIDGEPLTEDNLSGWRHGLGYIPQEPLILNASVQENLERFHPGATQEQMIDALKKAHAWEVVEKLPNGLDTVLGDGGIRLSGGERQRLVLARVLMGNPRLIIMDEATSAMDYESEAAVRSAIAQLKGQTTVVIIAHRLATVRTAERVLVLQDGMITEDGTLQELAICPNGYLNKLLYMD